MKFSIITPTFNSEKTIADTLESIKNQTYKNIEHIIIDGASKDSTLKIASHYDVKMVSEPDKGIYDAMNKGIELSTGDVVGILNSDDKYHNEKVLVKIFEKFEKEDCDVIFGNINIIDKYKNIIRSWKPGDFVKGSFFKGWHPPHPAFFVKKKIYNKYGKFLINLNLAADFEFMLRILEKENVKAEYLDEIIVDMGFGGATTGSLKNIIKGNLQCIQAFKINGYKTPFFYPMVRLLPKVKQFFSK